MANILSLCQDAATESKLTRPEAIVGVTDDEGATLLGRALVKTCRQLQAYNWQKLTREKTFTTVAAETQTDTPLATDFLRFVPNTVYNRDKRMRVFGPLSSDEWQGIKATASASAYDQFRLRGGSWIMSPIPTAGHTIAYEYITSYLGTDVTLATPRSSFTVDTDVTYWDDELVILGIAMNVLDIDGAEYAERSYQFQARLQKMLLEDSGNRILTNRTTERIPSAPRVPDFVSYT